MAVTSAALSPSMEPKVPSEPVWRSRSTRDAFRQVTAYACQAAQHKGVGGLNALCTQYRTDAHYRHIGHYQSVYPAAAATAVYTPSTPTHPNLQASLQRAERRGAHAGSPGTRAAAGHVAASPLLSAAGPAAPAAERAAQVRERVVVGQLPGTSQAHACGSGTQRSIVS